MPDISFDENDSFEVYLTQYIHDEDNNDTDIVWTHEFLDSAFSYDGFPDFSSFIGPVIPVQRRTLQSGHQIQNKLKLHISHWGSRNTSVEMNTGRQSHFPMC